MSKHPSFSCSYADIKICSIADVSADQVASYFKKNRGHLAATMPKKDDFFYTPEYWQEVIGKYPDEFNRFSAMRLTLVRQAEVIGTITYDNVVGGPFKACFLGYGIDQDYQAKGIMTSSLAPTLKYVINEKGLNRVMANYVPDNIPSGRVLKKLGFEREGYARKYLFLDGQWKDHILTSFVAD